MISKMILVIKLCLIKQRRDRKLKEIMARSMPVFLK